MEITLEEAKSRAQEFKDTTALRGEVEVERVFTWRRMRRKINSGRNIFGKFPSRARRQAKRMRTSQFYRVSESDAQGKNDFGS